MIASMFFFLFSQLGVGMMLALLFISPRRIGNGFFKFASLTAAILMGVTLGFNFIFPSLYRDSHGPEILLLVSVILTILYNRVVNLDKFAPALLLLIGATATGLVSIAWDSLAFTGLLHVAGWEHWMLAINHFAATALLGSVLLAMVFGHWYLVIPSLQVSHLQSIVKVHVVSMIARVAVVSAAVFLAIMTWQPGLGPSFKHYIMSAGGIFFWQRVLFGLAGPALLSYLTWETAKIRSTQSATGILYVDFFTVVVGEVLAKYLLLATRVPV